MKEKVAIVTDSTCDLDNEVTQEYDIKVLPLKVIYPHREYLDRIEITPQEVYEQMPEVIPTTSLPSPADIKELFTKLQKEGYTYIISVHISSGLSGTYNVVRTIARDFPDMVIEVLDSKALSLGLGIPVLEAAKTLRETNSFQAALDKAKRTIENIEIYFVVSTLEYLKKGGRIGYVAGTIGEIMQIKPIISINEEGKYYTYDKVRGRKKSIQRLFEIAKEKIGDKTVSVAVMNSAAQEEASELWEKIKALPGVVKTYTGQIGPVMGVHAGPGLIGICIAK
ncbi:DegV family protein [Desulforamulus ferrireducens]|uniref:Fatty acid-binding protein DegV n=1 Tax=Desulforamulus ferrireducens TaxID=1833852 RepID=A0A1S6ISK4_9FIRM|nr:DegV family protein [Desulforamulus ferrireducens]AQS57750.1 fatty acid-binding protein DegV [Desulforamulus ferrireducens]